MFKYSPTPRPFWALLLAVLITGCSTYPDITDNTPELVPAFSRTGSSQLPNQWWRAFNDPELNGLVARALDGNLGLQASYQRLLQARAAADQQAAGLFPSLDANLGTERRESESTGIDRFSAGLSASYEVDLWGRVQALSEAEDLRALASEADYQAAAISLSGEIASNWFELVEQQAQRALAEQQLLVNQNLLTVIEASFSAGQAGAADVLRQRQLVASSEEQLTNLAGDIAVLENQLAVLLGEAPTRVSLPDKEALPELPPLPDTGVPGELVQRRPDVRQAWRLVQAADRELAAAISNRFPRLSLEASVSDEATNASELFDDWLVTLAGNLLLPVIDGGERRAAVTSAEAGLRERVHEYREAVLVAIQEVEDALARERQQQQRLASLERQTDLARASYRQLRRRYMNGAVSYTDVLSALKDQQDLQRTQLTARQQLLNYRVALYRALAGRIDRLTPDSSTPTNRSEKDQA